MIIALVQIPGIQRSEADAIKAARGSAPTFTGMPGLKRKYYLNGEAGGGGVYLWESREAAEAWYDENWADNMEKKFGARPMLTYYENYVVVDNDADEVRVHGVPEARTDTAAE
ncbi:monooxygenase [Oceanicola sp. 22II-s10i]|uniref:monooxygenase n=1 Tax=Oceanicola sp. 22II-s10i TaxID=1317116 RepID=UPI000B528F69|nr:monooxygenase [Oceanicola sp. 22II-s10i]